MEISSQTNNYQMMNNLHQQPVTIQPVEPKPENEHGAGEVYEASNGNAITTKDGGLELTPQGQNNIANAQEAAATETANEAQAAQDAKRGTAVDYIGAQSKQSQIEIYLSVATDSKVEVGTDGDTASIIESLRDVQKQNNAVEAYATYQENQNPSQAFFA